MHTKTNHLFCFHSQLKLMKCLSLKYHLFLSASSMYTQSSRKPGTDSVPFYMDFGSNSKRFGRFTVSQISRNGQLHTEPTFQVFRKDNSGTFEKYQQLRIGDCEFQKFCFLKEYLLNGEQEMRENQPQFDKNISIEHVLEQCHKVREISIGRNLDLMLLFSIHQGQPRFNLCTNSTFLSKAEQR